jgi:hypothetical protein
VKFVHSLEAIRMKSNAIVGYLASIEACPQAMEDSAYLGFDVG